jgi:hypothetical protein
MSNSEAPRKSEFSIYDKANMAIALVALLLSLATAYLTFHRDDDVLVRVVGTTIDYDPETKGVTVVTYLALVNRGNQTALVTGIESSLSTLLGTGDPRAAKRTFPVALEKGHSRILEVCENLTKLVTDSTTREKALYSLTIASLDGLGKERGAKVVSAELEYHGGNLVAATPRSDATHLFGGESLQVRTAVKPFEALSKSSRGFCRGGDA